MVAAYRNRRQRVNRVTQRPLQGLQEELLVERRPVKLEPLEQRERRNRVSKRAQPGHLELLEQLGLSEQQGKLGKPDRLQVKPHNLVPRRLEQPQLRLVLEELVLETSEQELSLAREERQYPEHRLLLPEPSAHLVPELLDSLDKPLTLLRLGNSARTPIRQRPAQLDKR